MRSGLTAQTRQVSAPGWPQAPPAYDAAGLRRTRPTLGAIALGLVLAGPALMTTGFVITIVLGWLLPLPVFLTAAATLLAAPCFLVLAAGAIWRNSGRWKGFAALLAAAPVTALAYALTVPLLDLIQSA